MKWAMRMGALIVLLVGIIGGSCADELNSISVSDQLESPYPGTLVKSMLDMCMQAWAEVRLLSNCQNEVEYADIIDLIVGKLTRFYGCVNIFIQANRQTILDDIEYISALTQALGAEIRAAERIDPQYRVALKLVEKITNKLNNYLIGYNHSNLD